MLWIFYTTLTIVGAVLHILIAKTPIIYTFLLYFFVISIGANGITAFFGHAFRSNEIAKYIGWPAGNPFQFEVACASLGIGTLGILCIWFRGNFWLATAIVHSIFVLGAGVGHIREMVKNKNFAPGNAGAPLYSDFLKPLVLWSLLIAYRLGF